MSAVRILLPTDHYYSFAVPIFNMVLQIRTAPHIHPRIADTCGQHCSILMIYKSTKPIADTLRLLHFEITAQYPSASHCELQRAGRFRHRLPGPAPSLSAALTLAQPQVSVYAWVGPSWVLRPYWAHPFSFPLVAVGQGAMDPSSLPLVRFSLRRRCISLYGVSLPPEYRRGSFLPLHPVIEGRPLQCRESYFPLYKLGHAL